MNGPQNDRWCFLVPFFFYITYYKMWPYSFDRNECQYFFLYMRFNSYNTITLRGHKSKFKCKKNENIIHTWKDIQNISSNFSIYNDWFERKLIDVSKHLLTVSKLIYAHPFSMNTWSIVADSFSIFITISRYLAYL